MDEAPSCNHFRIEITINNFYIVLYFFTRKEMQYLNIRIYIYIYIYYKYVQIKLTYKILNCTGYFLL